MKTTRCYLLLLSKNLVLINLLGKLTKTIISRRYFIFSQISAIIYVRIMLSMLSVCCSLLLFLITYYSVIVKFGHWGFVG